MRGSNGNTGHTSVLLFCFIISLQTVIIACQEFSAKISANIPGLFCDQRLFSELVQFASGLRSFISVYHCFVRIVLWCARCTVRNGFRAVL
uniref:Putative secreted protein n=1 Tax=Ixodes ricinus TaxID=34613 RepID=A0A6B0UBA5_IXORI